MYDLHMYLTFSAMCVKNLQNYWTIFYLTRSIQSAKIVQVTVIDWIAYSSWLVVWKRIACLDWLYRCICLHMAMSRWEKLKSSQHVYTVQFCMLIHRNNNFEAPFCTILCIMQCFCQSTRDSLAAKHLSYQSINVMHYTICVSLITTESIAARWMYDISGRSRGAGEGSCPHKTSG